MLLQAFGIPQGDANALAVDLCLEVFGGEGRVVATKTRGGRGGGVGPLFGGQSEGNAEEVDERGLAAALGTDDKDAAEPLAFDARG